MANGNDNNQDKAKDSPEEKRQKFIDEEVKEKEEFVDEIVDIEVLRSLYKKDCRSHVRRRLLQEEEKAELKSKFEASERDKAILEKFARQSSCPNKLRHAMEVFPKRYLISLDDANRRQNDLHSKLLEKLNPKPRVTYLTQLIPKISSFTSTSIQSSKEEFELIWTKLKAIKGGLSKEVLSEKSSLGSLAKAVISLYEMCSIDDAMIQWCKDESVWKSRNTKLSAEDVKDLHELAKLSVNMLIQSEDSGKIFKNAEEMRYALDVVKIGAVFADNVSKQYKLCLWTVYMADHSEIRDLEKNLEFNWPNLEQAERLHLYCKEFAHLYNIVSDLDKHGPGLTVPDNCEPSENDYENYLHHLMVSAGRDICVVAKTLYSPKI